MSGRWVPQQCGSVGRPGWFSPAVPQGGVSGGWLQRSLCGWTTLRTGRRWGPADSGCLSPASGVRVKLAFKVGTQATGNCKLHVASSHWFLFNLCAEQRPLGLVCPGAVLSMQSAKISFLTTQTLKISAAGKPFPFAFPAVLWKEKNSPKTQRTVFASASSLGCMLITKKAQEGHPKWPGSGQVAILAFPISFQTLKALLGTIWEFTGELGITGVFALSPPREHCHVSWCLLGVSSQAEPARLQGQLKSAGKQTQVAFSRGTP